MQSATCKRSCRFLTRTGRFSFHCMLIQSVFVRGIWRCRRNRVVSECDSYFFYSLSHFFSSIECDKTTLSFIFTESWFIYLLLLLYWELCDWCTFVEFSRNVWERECMIEGMNGVWRENGARKRFVLCHSSAPRSAHRHGDFLQILRH